MRSLAMRTLPALALLFFVPLSGVRAASSPAGSDAPLLTLDEAVALALADNRQVKVSFLESDKAADELKTARSKRLPQFHLDVLAGSLLQPFDFTFPQGSFGTYPGIGQVPATDAAITTPAQFTTFATAAIDQPLSQQYKIHLAIHATELGREIAREDLRAQRQKTAAAVRNAYFELVATQTAMEAARDAVTTLTEVQRVTLEHQAQQTMLHADALEVEARLARSRYDLSTAENGVATQREALNDLLGRDLATPFRVEPTSEESAPDLSLEDARQRAAQDRPEIRQAQLRERQAEYERRLAKAEFIPDVSASVRYLGFDNFEVLPQNIKIAGLFLTWEPFDWGRRRNRLAQQTKAVEQARTGAQQAQSQIAVDVGMKYRRWSDSALLVKATRTGYDAAREQLRVISDKYKVEAALLKDLLQAETRSTEALFQYQQALSSYWSAMADLRRAMGEE